MTPAPQTSEPRRKIVGVEQDHATVAAIVRELMDQLSWNKSRELVRTGRVTVDGAPCFDPATRLSSGALVEIDPTGKRRRTLTLERERLVHVDAEIVVVEKPAGLISVPYDKPDKHKHDKHKHKHDPHEDSLIERTRVALLGHDRDRDRDRDSDEDDEPSSDRLGVVQRLDTDTTGLMVFARTRRARKILEAQFRAQSVERRYVALVHGHAEAVVHESYLVPDRGDGLRGSWRGPKPHPAAKRAITKVRVEERLRAPSGAELTLISCRIETGRQHQIRIHLAEAGNSLVGEQVYGRPRDLDPRAQLGAMRPMLHAASLGFRHPVHDRPLRFESPLPVDFRALLDSLRKV